MEQTTEQKLDNQQGAEGTPNPEGTPTGLSTQQGDLSTENTETKEGQDKDKQTPPEKYDFKAPEGVETLDADAVEAFTPIAKELGLNQEQAQKLVDLYAKQMQRQQESLVAQRESWEAEVKADPNIGGAKLTENIEHAKKALDKFGSPELIELLESTGMGSHPQVVKCFVNIGKAFSEDSFVSSTTAGAGTEKSAAEKLYGGN